MSAATATNATSTTTQTFLTALASNSILLGIEISAFVLLKTRLNRIYTPRTYLPPPEKRARPLPSGPWKWLPAIAVIPAEDVIHKNGLDAYMFLRFLRLMIIIFGVFTLVTWAVLLPINVAGVNGKSAGLGKLSWGNISDTESNRYIAHVIIVYLLTFWVIYLIRLEYIHYTHMRHRFLSSKSHSHLPQARTVLITSIPHQMCSERELRIWASFVPGGVQNIWIYRDTRELNKAHERRLQACEQLEYVTSKLLRLAVKEWQRRREMHNAEELYRYTQGPGSSSRRHRRVPRDIERGSPFHPQRHNHKFSLDDLVPRAKRPRHRQGFFGIVGRKVDTFKHYKREISHLNAKIDDLRRKIDTAKPLGSAFIQCNLQMGAHVLAQCVSHHEASRISSPLKMSYKWVHVNPKDIIWANIDDGGYEVRLRYVTSWMASVGITILWFFPVSFVGLLSNISQLCAQVRWLAWICRAPTPVPGFLQGVLSPLTLAIVFTVMPCILRGLAWYENIPLYSLLYISVYKRYFPFLVVHGFLIVTLSSGLAATFSDIINNPAKTVSQLASHLPDASVFFLTWTVTQGLTGAGGALLQIGTLFIYYTRKWFFGNTPRQAFTLNFLMPSTDFGTVFAQMSLLATIGFAYSVLSPIINGLATLAFVLFYLAWKFLLNWVFDQLHEQETGGLYYPVAMQSLFVGLYIEQVCLAALFFLKISSGPFFLALGILMLILLVITMSAQIFLKKSYDS
ncbi:DUF221-domain-containing protein [Gautieria morchelliformis]|nr:DUF221-domain-containing protein [Gautieria morchelliformis]